MSTWTRDTPWRQGQLLDAATAAMLGLEPGKLFIVATHDCDLAQLANAEPDVELIAGQPIDALNGNNTHAKNARKLHIAFDGPDSVIVEFDATSKFSMSKTALAGSAPRADTQLSPESQAIFQIWLASRYRRSAFPDEFERRLTTDSRLAEKIAKALKPHGAMIAGIFFDVECRQWGRGAPQRPRRHVHTRHPHLTYR